MTAILMDWLTFLLRWFHVVAGIAWVGASFYFIWVENALQRGGEQRHDKVAGHLWAIHGGGFYYLEKQSVAPLPLPAPLHWFKWEAYTTWLTGIALMVLVYYWRPAGWLVASGADLSGGAAVALSLAYLLLSYLLYSGLSHTPLLAKPRLFGVVGLGWIALSVWGMDGIFTPRAIFLHMGAMMGTIMAANVAMVIIPTQKKIVAAAELGEQIDKRHSLRAGLMSLHNNYIVLPVIFFMLALHFPLLAASSYAPLLAVIITAMAVCIRHSINLKNQGKGLGKPPLVAAAILLAVAIWLSLPPAPSPSATPTATDNATAATTTTTTAATAAVSDAQVHQLIEKHCVSCHSATPTSPIFPVAPLGYVLDTPAQIESTKDKIYNRTVVDKTMPFNNETNMTDAERQIIARWYRGE